jgi:hypothetical protein
MNARQFPTDWEQVFEFPAARNCIQHLQRSSLALTKNVVYLTEQSGSRPMELTFTTTSLETHLSFNKPISPRSLFYHDAQGKAMAPS